MHVIQISLLLGSQILHLGEHNSQVFSGVRYYPRVHEEHLPSGSQRAHSKEHSISQLFAEPEQVVQSQLLHSNIY